MIRNYDDFSRTSLEAALSLKANESLEFVNLAPTLVLSAGSCEGRLTGGNLALITSLLGTPYEIDTKGKVLLIEDVDESVPRVSRMLHHLKFAGKFDDAAGVLVGDFTDCKNPHDESYGVEALFQDFFTPFKKPVIANVRTGHDFPMATVPLGALCRLTPDGKIFFRP